MVLPVLSLRGILIGVQTTCMTGSMHTHTHACIYKQAQKARVSKHNVGNRWCTQAAGARWKSLILHYSYADTQPVITCNYKTAASAGDSLQNHLFYISHAAVSSLLDAIKF